MTGDARSAGDQPAVQGGRGGVPVDRPVVVTRTESRERALQLLYAAEARSVPLATVLGDQVVAPDPYAATLAGGVADHLAELDATISAHLRHWRIDRLAWMDLCVLRLGTYELAHEPEVPTAVVIDEAVELAKRYSTEESGAFVNGVLAAAAGVLRP